MAAIVAPVTVGSCRATTGLAATAPRVPRRPAGHTRSPPLTESGWYARSPPRRPPRCTAAPAAITRSSPVCHMSSCGRPDRLMIVVIGTAVVGRPVRGEVLRLDVGDGDDSAFGAGLASSNIVTRPTGLNSGIGRSGFGLGDRSG